MTEEKLELKRMIITPPETVLHAICDELEAQLRDIAEDKAHILAEWTDLNIELHAVKQERDIVCAQLLNAQQDAERIDWLEKFVTKNRVEIARSLYDSGFEFGWYPKNGPTAISRAGGIRVVIDEMMRGEK
jgi:hypothetical protein